MGETPELLDGARFRAARDFIYRHGRLLERQMFAAVFEDGSRDACLAALRAYQNADGGFGNGIEPDLLLPDSTGIGAETAMMMLELLGCQDADVVGPLVAWIARSQSDAGAIPHPPATLFDYPHQPWWEHADEDRILTLAGLLEKWGTREPEIARGARMVFDRTEPLTEVAYYDYPRFVYLKYCGVTAGDRARLAHIVDALPALLDASADHFPLFSRAWFWAADDVDPEVLRQNAAAFVAALQPDGGVVIPYPDLPWWRPPWTLDGLILLARYGFV